MKELIGKTINAIFINDSQDFLKFDTDDGPVSYITFGDCCSESWFADINGVSFLLGGKVISAEEVSMDGYNVEDGRTRQEYDEAYGWKLTTDRGYADIVFRNSSNGYYGGWMELYNPSKYSFPEPTVNIAEDWSA